MASCPVSNDLVRYLTERDKAESLDLAVEKRLEETTAAGGTHLVDLVQEMPVSLQRQINAALTQLIQGQGLYKASTDLKEAVEKYLTAVIRDEIAEAELDAAETIAEAEWSWTRPC